MLRARLSHVFPDAPWGVFGHLAGSNLQLNIIANPSQPYFQKRFEPVIYGVTSDCSGSISAEHGIGSMEVTYLGLTHYASKLDLMAEIKKLFDPGEILSPGRILGYVRRK